MTSKSQTELEQPAKVYQLMATDAKVDQALAMLKTISESVSGVVTESQLNSRLKDFEKNIDDKIADDIKNVGERITNEVKAIHLKYGPTYSGIWWVVGVMATGLITMFWAMINNFWRGS